MAKAKQGLIRGMGTHRRTEGDYMAALLDTVTLEDWRDVPGEGGSARRSLGERWCCRDGSQHDCTRKRAAELTVSHARSSGDVETPACWNEFLLQMCRRS